MLDQNTDRMWYVIGAVIIGAAIILIMNKTFPQLFASVGDTFKDKTNQTTEIVDGILPKTRNFIKKDAIVYHVWVDERTGIEQPVANSAQYYASSAYMPVEPDMAYVFKMNNGDIVHNLRVVYFDAEQNYITGNVTVANKTSSLETIAPSNAAYARVSAPYTAFVQPHAPIDQWWFGLK